MAQGHTASNAAGKRFSLQGGLLTLLCLALWGAATPPLHAAQLMGADLALVCLNACTTRVEGRLYADCHAGMPAAGTIVWAGQPGCTAPSALGPNSTVVYTDITPTCPAVASWCALPFSGPIGVIEASWYRDYDICGVPACAFFVNWSDCCRPGNLTNLLNPVTTGYSVGVGTHTGVTPCNNTPQFVHPPVTWICTGRDQYFDQGAHDVDGDSLTYELGPCADATGMSVVYATNCFPTGPFGAGWSVTIDAATGMVFFDAHPGNAINAVLCIYIREYRNGALISTTSRDMVFAAQPCTNANASPQFEPLSNVSGALNVVGNDIDVCLGSPLCFDIAAQDSNAAQNLRLWWDGLLAGATLVDAGNANIQDTITGLAALPPTARFCWAPMVVGTHYLRLHVEDDHCHVNGRRDEVYRIHVLHNPPTVTAMPGPCPTVQFGLQGCVNGSQSYAWSGAGGLNSTSANPLHTYPGPGTYPWQLIVTTGTVVDTLAGSVTVSGAATYQPLFSGLHFVAPCTGQLYDTLHAGNWASYQWNTGATSADLVVFLGGMYGVTVTDTAGCAYRDSVELVWPSPDIYGLVQTSGGAPLQNQRILLIGHDTTLQTLTALDSTWTDSLGYYFFCNVSDSVVHLKATPQLGDYPLEMPTYADTSLFWNQAITFYPFQQQPFRHDFATLPGINPGGPGFIGGFISQGANKVSSIGDPVPGLRIFLRDRNSGAILGYRDSDANGYFSFAGIPLGDYALLPDKPLVSTSNVPFVSLSSTTPLRDSLGLLLHRYWLELVPFSVAVAPVAPGFSAAVLPNPFGQSAELQLRLHVGAVVDVRVTDVMGRLVERVQAADMAAGLHAMRIGERLSAGTYCVQVRAGEELRVLRVVKD